MNTRSESTRWLGLPVVWLLVPILLVAIFVAPVSAWESTCLDLCSAIQPLQSYSTGANDSACLEACNEGGAGCKDDWEVYFQCVEDGDPMSDCWRYFTEAKQCSVCRLGKVDLEGTDQAIFVNNGTTCSYDVAVGGSLGLPLCEFTLGIEKARQQQALGISSKVEVCRGTYFDEVADPTVRRYGSVTSQANVIVESVTRHEALVTGSDDWSGAWGPVSYSDTETRHNTLLRSIDPGDTNVWHRLSLVPMAPAAPTLPVNIPGDPSVPRGFAATSTNTEHFLRQTVTPFGGRRVTFSTYLYPNGVQSFRLLLLQDQDGDPSSPQVSNGAWFDFELPLTAAACGLQRSSSNGEGEVEDLGNGWFRVSLTQTFDTIPSANGTLPLVAGAQLSLLGPLAETIWAGDGLSGVEIFGPQLDHRPLDEFAAQPRDYEWTNTAAVSQTTNLPAKTLYVNNPQLERWPHDWGLARHGDWGRLPPIVRRAEMVFVNGVALRQVLSFADLRPGTFLIDDQISYGGSNYKLDSSMIPGSCDASSPCPIYIEPPAGANMVSADVRVAIHPRLLWMNPVNDWEFRGLVFRHATGAYDEKNGGDKGAPLNTSAVTFANAAELTLLENLFEWNNAFGVAVSGTSPRIKPALMDSNNELTRNVARYNGIAGAFVGMCKSCTVTEDEYSYNNWRGALGGFRGHTTTGAKFAANIDLIVRGLVASHNAAHGLWLDFENQLVQVLDSRFEGNDGTGIYFEGNDEWCSQVGRPLNIVDGCVVQNNDVGVRLIGSRASRLSQNHLVGNRVALSLIGDPYVGLDKACYPPDGLATPKRWLRDLYFDNNQVSASCRGDLWLHYGDNAVVDPNDPINSYWAAWKPVMETMTSFDNTYSHVSGLGTQSILIKQEALKLGDLQACDPALASAADWCFAVQDQGSIEQ